MSFGEAEYNEALAIQASMVVAFGPMAKIETAEKMPPRHLKEIIRASKAFKEKKHRHCSSFEAIGAEEHHPLAQYLLQGARMAQETYCSR